MGSCFAQVTALLLVALIFIDYCSSQQSLSERQLKDVNYCEPGMGGDAEVQNACPTNQYSGSCTRVLVQFSSGNTKWKRIGVCIHQYLTTREYQGRTYQETVIDTVCVTIGVRVFWTVDDATCILSQGGRVSR